jgi:uncharacterized membrane protein
LYNFNKSNNENFVNDVKDGVNNLFYTVFVFIFLPMWLLFVILLAILAFARIVSWWTLIVGSISTAIFLVLLVLLLRSSIRQDVANIENTIKKTTEPYFTENFLDYVEKCEVELDGDKGITINC